MAPKNAGPGIILVSMLFYGALVRPLAYREARLAGISDISETLQEISNVLKGIYSFISSLSSIPLLSTTIGFDTILLFIGIVVFTAGFSAIGVPKGKFSFLASLVTADALWVLWKESMKAEFPGYLAPILKSNLIVLTPFILVMIFSAAFPHLWMKFKRSITSLFHRKTAFNKKDFLALYDEYQERSTELNRLIVSDMLASGASEKTSLSQEAVKSIEDLKSTLEKFSSSKQ
jgi:hypothetical protein